MCLADFFRQRLSRQALIIVTRVAFNSCRWRYSKLHDFSRQELIQKARPYLMTFGPAALNLIGFGAIAGYMHNSAKQFSDALYRSTEQNIVAVKEVSKAEIAAVEKNIVAVKEVSKAEIAAVEKNIVAMEKNIAAADRRLEIALQDLKKGRWL